MLGEQIALGVKSVTRLRVLRVDADGVAWDWKPDCLGAMQFRYALLDETDEQRCAEGNSEYGQGFHRDP